MNTENTGRDISSMQGGSGIKEKGSEGSNLSREFQKKYGNSNAQAANDDYYDSNVYSDFKKVSNKYTLTAGGLLWLNLASFSQPTSEPECY